MNILSAKPQEGKVGDTVVISGFGLGSIQGAGPGSVTFNGVKAVISSWTGEGITVIVPAGAVTGPLCVAAGGGAAEVQFMVLPKLFNEPVEERAKMADPHVPGHPDPSPSSPKPTSSPSPGHPGTTGHPGTVPPAK